MTKPLSDYRQIDGQTDGQIWRHRNTSEYLFLQYKCAMYTQSERFKLANGEVKGISNFNPKTSFT